MTMLVVRVFSDYSNSSNIRMCGIFHPANSVGAKKKENEKILRAKMIKTEGGGAFCRFAWCCSVPGDGVASAINCDSPRVSLYYHQAYTWRRPLLLSRS